MQLKNKTNKRNEITKQTKEKYINNNKQIKHLHILIMLKPSVQKQQQPKNQKKTQKQPTNKQTTPKQN